MALAVLTRDTDVAVEEEVAGKYAARPATPFTNEHFFDVISGVIDEAHRVVVRRPSIGTGMPTDSRIVEKVMTWSLSGEINAEDFPWWWKWATGTLVAEDTNGGHYRCVLPTPRSVDLPSHTLYFSTQQPNFWSAGGETICLLGCKIGSMRIEGSQDADARKMMLSLSGIGQKPLVDMTGTIDVLDYADLAAGTPKIYIEVQGVLYTRTEGTDWTAETDNTTTAANIVTDINTNIPGLSASNNAGEVTIVAETGHNFSGCYTDASATDMTATLTSNDSLMPLPSLTYARTTLYNNVNPAPYLFPGTHSRLDSGQWGTGTEWSRMAIEVINNLAPITYARGEASSVYISDIRREGGQVIGEFDKDFIDSLSQVTNYRRNIGQKLGVRLNHDTSRLSTGSKYLTEFTIEDMRLRGPTELVNAGGDNAIETRPFTWEAHLKDAVTLKEVDAEGSGAHALDLDTVYVVGVSGDAEVGLLTPTANGYLDTLCFQAQSDASPPSSQTGDIFAAIYTEVTGDPGVILPGGESLAFSTDIFSGEWQNIYFRFPFRPYLKASTNYWIVVYAKTSGVTNVVFRREQVGSNEHQQTTDGGQTWVADTDRWDVKALGNNHGVVVDLFVQSAASDQYPDSV